MINGQMFEDVFAVATGKGTEDVQSFWENRKRATVTKKLCFKRLDSVDCLLVGNGGMENKIDTTI